MRIGIVAGEASGDILASRLIASIRQRHPDATFVGIAGPLMQQQGCEALFPSEKLAVMGLTEVLRHLPEILSIRRQVARYFIDNPPDVFIGVDAPDFNLTLENRLRQNGIRTVHYVSPSVWAWRQYRVKKIARSVDLMLCLFPFEADFYRRFDVPVEFVGHPLADEIPMESDKDGARATLGLDKGGTWVALLPGSRMGEVRKLTRLLLDTALQCLASDARLQFVLPCANARIRQYVESELQTFGRELPVTLVDGQSRVVMAAADVILLKSGTSTLEGMLVKRPMVVTYKVSALTYRIMRALATTRYVALPNVLAGCELVPELLQDQATSEHLTKATMTALQSSNPELHSRFTELHQQLRRDASARAADAVLALLA